MQTPDVRQDTIPGAPSCDVSASNAANSVPSDERRTMSAERATSDAPEIGGSGARASGS